MNFHLQHRKTRQISVTKKQQEGKNKMLHFLLYLTLGKQNSFFINCCRVWENGHKCNKIKNYSCRKNVTLFCGVDKMAVKSMISASSDKFSSFLLHLHAFFDVANEKDLLEIEKI